MPVSRAGMDACIRMGLAPLGFYDGRLLEADCGLACRLRTYRAFDYAPKLHLHFEPDLINEVN